MQMTINKRPVDIYKYNIALLGLWLGKQRFSDFENGKKLYAKFNSYYPGEFGKKQFVSAILYLKPHVKRVVKYDPKTQRMRYGLEGLNL